MNTCDYYQELISRLVDGEVSRDEYEDLMNHMNSCSRCNAMYAVFYDLSEILQNEEPEALPEGLHENIMAGVRRSAIEKKNRRLRATWVRTGLTAAACAVLVLFAARGLSPAGRTEGNVIRNSEEVQMSAPAQEAAAPAEESAPAPSMAPAATQTPVQTAPPATPHPAPAQTAAPSPAPTPTPVPTAASQAPTPDPYRDETYDAGSEATNSPTVAAVSATPAPAPKTTSAPAAADSVSVPSTAPAATAAAQPELPAETAETRPTESGETAAADEKTDSAAPSVSLQAAPPASLQAAAPAAESRPAAAEAAPAAAESQPESASGGTDTAVAGGASQETPAEEPVEAAPKAFLKSFRTLMRTPTPALAIPPEETTEAAVETDPQEPTEITAQPAETPAPSATPLPSPSATPAKESSFRLSGKENQKRLTELLGGTEKALPETEADAIVNVTLVPEDPFGGEEELSIRYYGDKVYYVTYPEEKQTKSFLADCGAEELKTLIRELRGEKTADSPAESPAVSPKATADPFLPDVPEKP